MPLERINPKRLPPLIRQLRKKVEKDVGKECKAINPSCVGCRVHLALATLEEFYGDVTMK